MTVNSKSVRGSSFEEVDDESTASQVAHLSRSIFEERVRSRNAQKVRLEMLVESSGQRAAQAQSAQIEAREIAAKAAARKAREEVDAEARRRVAWVDEWRAGQETTQSVLMIMRRHGVVSGVNPPPPQKEDMPDEKATHITIRLKSDDARETAWSKSTTAKRVAFNIDLSRFLDVEFIKGEQIGPHGATYLSELLCEGACPELSSLYLGWNGIRLAGFTSLMKALTEIKAQKAEGRRRDIVCLDIRANHISGEAMSILGVALEDGALPNLAHLDLRHNPLGNNGAKTIAHIILAGQLAAIETLNVSCCDIRDSGMRALASGLNCEHLKKNLMPCVELITARNNRASAGVMRSLGLWPAFVQV